MERVSWYRDKRRINRYELSRMKMFTDHRFLLEHDSSKCRNQTCNSLRLLITKEFDYELRTSFLLLRKNVMLRSNQTSNDYYPSRNFIRVLSNCFT